MEEKRAHTEGVLLGRSLSFLSRVGTGGGRSGERRRQAPVMESQGLAKEFTFYRVVKKKPSRVFIRCVSNANESDFDFGGVPRQQCENESETTHVHFLLLFGACC